MFSSSAGKPDSAGGPGTLSVIFWKPMYTGSLSVFLQGKPDEAGGPEMYQCLNNWKPDDAGDHVSSIGGPTLREAYFKKEMCANTGITTICGCMGSPTMREAPSPRK